MTLDEMANLVHRNTLLWSWLRYVISVRACRSSAPKGFVWQGIKIRQKIQSAKCYSSSPRTFAHGPEDSNNNLNHLVSTKIFVRACMRAKSTVHVSHLDRLHWAADIRLEIRADESGDRNHAHRRARTPNRRANNTTWRRFPKPYSARSPAREPPPPTNHNASSSVHGEFLCNLLIFFSSLGLDP